MEQADFDQFYENNVNNVYKINSRTCLYSDLIEIENKTDKQRNKNTRKNNINCVKAKDDIRKIENEEFNFNRRKNEDLLFDYYDEDDKYKLFEKRRINRNGANGKKRRRKKVNYKKNSTIIEIKKIN